MSESVVNPVWFWSIRWENPIQAANSQTNPRLCREYMTHLKKKEKRKKQFIRVLLWIGHQSLRYVFSLMLVHSDNKENNTWRNCIVFLMFFFFFFAFETIF